MQKEQDKVNTTGATYYGINLVLALSRMVSKI